MENCEAMTSSPHSFAYSYWLVKNCFLKICETSKCHNFLIFQPIFIRFSLLCLKIFTLSSEIKLNLLWSSSLRDLGCALVILCVHAHYTDGDFWRREHHGMFLSRGLKWYWGKIISPETKSRDLYSSRNIISNPKILGTFRDVPDNKVAICYIVWLPIALPGFGIARRNLQNSVFFAAGISFKLCAVQCVSIVLCAAVQRVSIVLCAQ